MVIHASSNQELAQLAELLLQKFLAFRDAQANCGDCGGGSTIVASPGITITDDEIYARVYIASVSFVVGAPGAPVDGNVDFEIRNEDGSKFSNVGVELYREGIYQTPSNQFQYDQTLNKISVTTALMTNASGKGERVTLKVFKEEMLVTGQVVPSVSGPQTGFPFTFPYNLS
jgi:hypothetical protein